MGDFNINLLDYKSQKPTESFLDLMLNNNMLPSITGPRRLRTYNYFMLHIDIIFEFLNFYTFEITALESLQVIILK